MPHRISRCFWLECGFDGFDFNEKEMQGIRSAGERSRGGGVSGVGGGRDEFWEGGKQGAYLRLGSWAG